MNSPRPLGALARAGTSIAAALLLATAARAEPPQDASMPARVSVAPSGCPTAPFAFDRFLSLLRLELRVEGVEQVDDSAAPAAQELSPAVVTLRGRPCGPEARAVEVQIGDPRTTRSVHRDIDLGDILYEDRPRALSLAVAELLRSSWTALSLAPPPSPLAAPLSPPPAAPSSPSPRSPAPPLAAPTFVAVPPLDRPSRFSLSASIDSRVFFGTGSGLVGARVSGAARLAPWLGLALDAGGLAGSRVDPLGQASLTFFSGGAWLFVRSGGAPLSLSMGPRLELGAAEASGSPSSPSVVAGHGGSLAALGSLSASVRAQMTTRLSAVVNAEVGGTLRGLSAQADDRIPIGIEGGFLGLRLGAEVAF